jgi:hypothetical protein
MKDIEQLVETLAADAAPVRSAPHPFMLSLKWIGAAAVYLTVSLAISGLRPDLAHALQQPWFIAEIVALLLVFIAAATSAALLAFPDLHQKRGVVFAPVIAFALFVLVMFLAWQADNPPAPLPPHSYECTVSITLFSLLPAAWMFFEMRKFASTHYRWAGIIALLAAFSVGELWLRLYEINDSIMHVVQCHYLPMMAFSIAGLWLGKRVFKW